MNFINWKSIEKDKKLKENDNLSYTTQGCLSQLHRSLHQKYS